MEINEAVVGVIVAAVGLIAVLITVVGPLVRERIGVWAQARWNELEMSLPKNVRDTIIDISRIVVFAVEQMYVGLDVEDKGRAKLKEAEVRIEAWLAMLGYEVELDRIREAIEFVVFEMNADKSTTPSD